MLEDSFGCSNLLLNGHVSKQGNRINRDTLRRTNLKMKMGPGATARITHPGNHITLSDTLTNSNKKFMAVRITRLVTVRMLNFNHQPISA